MGEKEHQPSLMTLPTKILRSDMKMIEGLYNGIRYKVNSIA
jgi:hypothetical protein